MPKCGPKVYGSGKSKFIVTPKGYIYFTKSGAQRHSGGHSVKKVKGGWKVNR